MRKRIALIALAIATITAAHSQETPLKKVDNVEILTLDGEPSMLPNWGEKNLLIFYIDPDKASQNQDFTDELEANGRAHSENIVGLGIINLKDAPFIPNKLARSMAQKRTEHNGAIVYADQDRTISTKWGLGDCNNKFVLMVINTDGEMIFYRKGQLSDDDKAAFYKLIDSIKQK